MTVEAEEFTPWQHLANTRMTMLEAARKGHAWKIATHEGLLSAMDSDVSNAQAAFRAQLAVLNALRATQNEQQDRLTSLETTSMAIEGRLTSVEEAVQKVHLGVDTIIGMLRRAEENEAGND